MTTEKYYICCEKCLETIAKHSTSAAKFWMDLCSCHKENGPLVFMYNESDEVKELEKLGFLISTETKNGLLVQAVGTICTKGEVFFCAKMCDHQNDRI